MTGSGPRSEKQQNARVFDGLHFVALSGRKLRQRPRRGIDRLAGIARGEIEAHKHSEHEAIEAAAVASGTAEAQDAATSEGMPTPETSEAAAADTAAAEAAADTPETSEAAAADTAAVEGAADAPAGETPAA